MKFYHLMPVACHCMMYTLIFCDIFAQLIATHSWWHLRNSGWGLGCWSWILRWWWRPGRPWSQIGRSPLLSKGTRATLGVAAVVDPCRCELMHRWSGCSSNLLETQNADMRRTTSWKLCLKRVLKVQILVTETITSWVLQEHKGPGPWGFGRHTGLSSMKFL